MDDMAKLISALSDIWDDIDFANEKSLVDDGLIDSLDLMKAIVALDTAFDIRIHPGEIEPENFNSAETMLALVRRYQQK